MNISRQKLGTTLQLASRSLWRRLWYASLWLIILSGIVLLLLQLALPVVAKPDRITRLLANYSTYDIVMESVKFETGYLRLTGAATNITVMSESGTEPQLQIGQLLFDCNPWLSLIRQKFYCREIKARNTIINIHPGHITANSTSNHTELLATILQWSSNISSLRLQNISINIDSEAVQLQVPDINMQHDQTGINGLVTMTIPPLYGEGIAQSRFLISKQLLRSPTIKFHLRADSFDLAAAVDLLPASDKQIFAGIRPAGKLHKLDMTGTWGYSGLQQLTATARAWLRFERDGRSINANIGKLAISADFVRKITTTQIGSAAINGEIWSGPDIIHSSHSNSGHKLWWPQLQTLNARSLQSLSQWWLGQDPVDYNGQIELGNAVLTLTPHGPEFSSTVYVNELHNADILADTLTGVLHYAGEKLRFDITAGNNMQLFLPGVMEPALDMQQPRGTVQLWQDNGELGEAGDTVLKITNSRAWLRGIDMTFTGLFLMRDNISYYGDLIVAADSEHQAADIIDHLPRNVGEQLRTALMHIIPQGNATRSAMLYRGYFDDYPFRDNQGAFQAQLQLHDLTIVPNDNAYRLDKVHGNLFFDNQTMRADLHSGKLKNLDISDSHLLIPDMTATNSVMNIRGNLAGPLQDIVHLAPATAMQPRVGSMDKYNIGGNAMIELLTNINNLDTNPKMQLQQALVSIDNGTITDPTWGELDNIRGELNLQDSIISSDNITASWRDQPATISMQYNLNTDNTTALDIRIPLNGELLQTIPALEFLATYVDGQSELHIGMEEQSAGYAYIISTDMYGLATTLPPPFGKAQDDKQKMLLHWQPENMHGSWAGVTMDYQAATASGSAEVVLEGAVDTFSMADWVPLMQATTGHSGEQNKLPDFIVNSKLTFASLELFGNYYSDVTTTMKPDETGDWRLQLASERLAANITIPQLWLQHRWQIYSEYIYLPKPEQNQNQVPLPPLADIDPNYTPTVSLQIESLYTGDADNGKLILVTERTAVGQRIVDITLDGTVQVSGTGEWLKSGNGDGHTSIDINIASRKMYFIAKLFNIGIDAKDASTSIDVTTTWPGTPADFSMRRILGEIQFEIDEGAMTDIHSDSSRFLSLFSLETILDRVRFDFSELASSKIEFNGISGSITVNGGVLHTDNMTMDGKSILVYVNGQVNLHDNTMDQEVIVVPKISSNMALLGVAGGLPGLGIGAAVILFNKIASDGGDLFGNLVRTKYHVSGSVDEPKIEKYEEQQNQNNDSHDSNDNGKQRNPLGTIP